MRTGRNVSHEGLILKRKRGYSTQASAIIVAILFFPSLSLGNYPIRIEHVLLPMILLALASNTGWRAFKFGREAALTVLFFLWSIAISLHAVIQGQGLTLNIAALAGVAMPAAVLIALSNSSISRDTAKNVLITIAYSAIPLGLFSMAQALNAPGAALLTQTLYDSSSRTAVTRLIEVHGYVARGLATFEMPSYAAFFFIVTIAIAYIIEQHVGVHGRVRKAALKVSIACACLGGIATVSVTFFAGSAMLAALLLATRLRPGVGRLDPLVAGTLLVIVTASVAITFTIAERSTMLGRQVDRLAEGSLFETRYGQEAGSLSGAMGGIVDAPAGHGWTVPARLHSGDSLYIATLYHTGVIGLALLLLLFVSIWRSSRAMPEVWRLVLKGVILVAIGVGIGTPTLWTPRVGLLWWIIIGLGIYAVPGSPAPRNQVRMLDRNPR